MAKEPAWEKYRFVHKLPYATYLELCRILNADGKWRDFAGRCLHLDVTTLTLIGQAIHRETDGPTHEVLQICSEKNWTVAKLFHEFAKLRHLRAMNVLKPYVDPKYHCLMDMEQQDRLQRSTRISEPPTDYSLPQPDFPLSSWNFSQHSSHYPHNAANYQAEGASSVEFQQRNLPRFQSNIGNMNDFASTTRLPPDVNQQDMVEEKKIIPSLKKNAVDVDSCSDNCAYFNCSESPCGAASPTNFHLFEKEKNLRKSPSPTSVVNKVAFMKGSFKPDQGQQFGSAFESFSSMEEALPDRFQISYKEILKSTDSFAKSRLLGKGGFGVVFKGVWKESPVAIKRLNPGQDITSKQQVSQKQLLNELKILYECRFDNILPLYGVSVDGPELCLVYQFMPNGSLEDHLLCKNDKSPLNWTERSNIAEGTAKGLNYLHTTPGKPLVHGDIKSANILLDANMDAKIGDFGLTREGPDSHNTHVKVTTVHGTQVYLPPEYLRDRHLSTKVDVYSYGIVLLEMATGLRPFDNKRDGNKHLMDYVERNASSGHLSSLIDEKAGEEGIRWFHELIDIGQKCASKQKKKRPEMAEVLSKINDVKQELAVIPRVRRPTPLELQKYYDETQKYSNNPETREVPSYEGACMNQIRYPPSVSYDLDPPSYREVQEASFAATIGSSRNCSISQPDRACNPVDDNSSSFGGNGQAPLPLVTMLHVGASQFNNITSESLSSAGPLPSGIISDIHSRDSNYYLPDSESELK